LFPSSHNHFGTFCPPTQKREAEASRLALVGEQAISINIKGISTYGLKFSQRQYRNLIEVIINFNPFLQLKPLAKTTATFLKCLVSADVCISTVF